MQRQGISVSVIVVAADELSLSAVILHSRHGTCLHTPRAERTDDKCRRVLEDPLPGTVRYDSGGQRTLRPHSSLYVCQSPFYRNRIVWPFGVILFTIA